MQIPDKWLRAFMLMQGVCPEAVLAGGALRDLDNDRLEYVKDLDIFVQSRGGRAFEEIQSRLEPLFGAPTVPFEIQESYLLWNSSMMGFMEFDFEGLPVQIIGLDLVDWSADLVLSRIDMGICQIAWDGEKFFWTDGYSHDKDNKVMTVSTPQTAAQSKQTVKRWERLREKYPGWGLNLPRGLMVDENETISLLGAW
jgi:hypothetical protein